MQILLDVIVPVFMIVGFGYISVWQNYFDENLIDALLKFTQNFAIPVLLFKAMSEVDLAQTFDPKLLIAFYTGASSGFFLGFSSARYIFGKDWQDCVTIGFCCLFSNSLMLGLAITERAYGTDALNANLKSLGDCKHVNLLRRLTGSCTIASKCMKSDDIFSTTSALQFFEEADAAWEENDMHRGGKIKST